jgi:hypothetical protein
VDCLAKRARCIVPLQEQVKGASGWVHGRAAEWRLASERPASESRPYMIEFKIEGQSNVTGKTQALGIGPGARSVFVGVG